MSQAQLQPPEPVSVAVEENEMATVSERQKAEPAEEAFAFGRVFHARIDRRARRGVAGIKLEGPRAAK
jgi:hypothetical protein